MTADDPSVNGAYINWFEGNVGIGLDGTLYVPNDNYFVYAVDRDTGNPKWKFKMPDQTWSLPAVDTANGGTLYIGNNELVPLLGANTYGIEPDGSEIWSASTIGTVAASPMLTKGGLVVVGAFDGYAHAYDHSGNSVWTFPARDHIYASAALLPDGSIVVASADGTAYDLDPLTGTQNWQFDTPSPIRSSPAIDADGNVDFGGGDGNLYVLDPDGKLRWSMLLIDADRNDLNSSPALGTDAIYIGGESGQLFSVPYDYCLRPEGTADARCSTTPPRVRRRRRARVDDDVRLPRYGAPHRDRPDDSDHAHARRSHRQRRGPRGNGFGERDRLGHPLHGGQRRRLGGREIRHARPPDAVHAGPRRDRVDQRARRRISSA